MKKKKIYEDNFKIGEKIKDEDYIDHLKKISALADQIADKGQAYKKRPAEKSSKKQFISELSAKNIYGNNLTNQMRNTLDNAINQKKQGNNFNFSDQYFGKPPKVKRTFKQKMKFFIEKTKVKLTNTWINIKYPVMEVYCFFKHEFHTVRKFLKLAYSHFWGKRKKVRVHLMDKKHVFIQKDGYYLGTLKFNHFAEGVHKSTQLHKRMSKA